MRKSIGIVGVCFFVFGWGPAHAESRAFGIELCSAIFVFQGEVYFCGKHRRLGRELFRSNGTKAGTTVVADIDPGPGSSDPINFFRLKEHLYFFAENSGTGREIWRTDGTKGGTKRISEAMPGPNGFPAKVTVFSDASIAYIRDDSIQDGGLVLWRTDGTSDGTERILSSGPDDLTLLGFYKQKFYLGSRSFTNEGISLSLERISSTGSEPEVVKVLGEGCESNQRPNPYFDIRLSNDLERLFVATNCKEESAVFVSDGTELGTKLLLEGQHSFIGQLNSFLYYYNRDQNNIHYTDGESTDTLGFCGVSVFCLDGRIAMNGQVNGRFLFSLLASTSEEAAHSDAVYATDGTAQGTAKLTDGFINGFARTNGSRALFDISRFGRRNLWTTDGTVNGTKTLQFADAGFASNGQIFSTGQQFMFFEKRTYESTSNLWRSDGLDSERIVRFSRDFDQVRAASSEGNRLYFDLADILWHTDGTEEGTYQLTYLDDVPVVPRSDFDGSQIIPSIDLLLDEEN